LAGQAFLGIDLAGINRNAAASPSSLIERGTRWFEPRRGCGPARRCGWAPAGSSRPASLCEQTLGRETQALSSTNHRKRRVNSIKVISCKVIS
jgi:hypothetical protein